METTSNASARILHLLTTHPEVQEKLRAEILHATEGVGDLSYDELNALPFLDAVCRETLRLYVRQFHETWDESDHSTDTHPYRLSTERMYIAPLSSTIILTCSSILSRTEKDAILPLSVPVKGIDGSLIDKLVIPAGTSIILPINNANCDPALWGPDSREWKPDRWLSPLPEYLFEAHVPGVYSHMYDDTHYCPLKTFLD